jgi:hypothetical protein
MFFVRRFLLSSQSSLFYVRSCENPADVPSRLALPLRRWDLYGI